MSTILIGMCLAGLVLLWLFSRFVDKTTSGNILSLVGLLVGTIALLLVYLAIVGSRL